MVKIKNKINTFNNKYWKSVIFIILIIIGGLLIFKKPTLFWDEGVYINNAKYIYSLGEQSTYENIRPPLFPIIIGLAIPLGIDIILFSKIFIFLCYLAGLIFIYLISEKIYTGSGIFSTITLSTCSLVLFVLPHILTDFLVLTFMLIALYFFINKKLFLAGLFCGISTLLRFPAGLLIIIFGIFLLEKDIKKTIKQELFLALGALLLIVPYLISNKLLFNSFFKPIINAQLIVAQSKSNFFIGAWFFTKVLLTQNFIFLFIILFAILLLLKKINGKNYFLLLTVSIIYFLYFSQLPHFEDRYILLLIPFGAIISGIVITYCLNKLPKIKFWIPIFITSIIFLLLFLIIILNNSFKIYNSDVENDINFLKEIGQIDTELLFIYDPITGVYFNKKLIYVINPYYTNKFIEQYPDVNYMVLSEKMFDCDVTCMDCDNANQCLELEKLEKTLEKNWKILNTENVYGAKYYIYKKIDKI